MTLLYWKWHLIPRWHFRNIFARFPEQLLKDLLSWRSPGECSMIDLLILWKCFRGFVLRVWEYCSAVWCSAADTQIKLLYRALCCARFLTGGVFECDIAHRRSVAVLCVLYKIRCNPVHPLNGAILGPYVPVRVTRGALVAHRYTYAPPSCWTLLYSRTFIPLLVSLWNDLANPVFDGVGLAGFKAWPMLFYWPKLLYPNYSPTIFPFFFFLSIGWYCGAGVSGLIGGISLSLSLLLPIFLNNNNNKIVHGRNTHAGFSCGFHLSSHLM